jgi:hypothetical protein
VLCFESYSWFKGQRQQQERHAMVIFIQSIDRSSTMEGSTLTRVL